MIRRKQIEHYIVILKVSKLIVQEIYCARNLLVMLNSLLNCSCLRYWAEKEEEIDYSILQNIEKNDVTLDTSKSGKFILHSMELARLLFKSVTH